MTNIEYEVARAEIRARGVAEMRKHEREAAAMLERGSKLTAAERRDYTATLHLARVLGLCILNDSDVLPNVTRVLVDTEIEKVKTGEA